MLVYLMENKKMNDDNKIECLFDKLLEDKEEKEIMHLIISESDPEKIIKKWVGEL